MLLEEVGMEHKTYAEMDVVVNEIRAVCKKSLDDLFDYERYEHFVDMEGDFMWEDVYLEKIKEVVAKHVSEGSVDEVVR